MANDGSFDKLVSELSLNERQNLFEKLKTESTILGGSLYFEDEKLAPAYDIREAFSAIPWYLRLWYTILSLFKPKLPVKIFEEKRVAILGEMIDKRTPGLYDYKKVMLMPGFYRQVQRLKEAAQFFYAALDSSVNRDKGEFFAFLGSLEMPDVHKLLQEETTPQFLKENNPDVQDAELRQMALRTMDEAFAMITENYRNVMYFNSRTLNCLKELSSFLYDRALLAFQFNSNVGGETCSAGVLKDLLVTLNDILFSLKLTPPLTLLESLFIFTLQEKAREPGSDINKEISVLLAKAENSIMVIREFNRQVPLIWILRCTTRNMALAPNEISGGEGWFVIYKDYWKRRIDSLFSDYMKVRHHHGLLDSFGSFLKGNNIKTLENVQSPSNSEGLPIKGALAISFLYTFYSVVFLPDISWVLEYTLIEGKWEDTENQLEFTESYNTLLKLEDEIKKFEYEVSIEGDYGKRYTQAKQNMSSLNAKRKKAQTVLDEAAEDVRKILKQTRDACESIGDLLNGILGENPKGKYLPLKNFAIITRQSNRYIAGISETIKTIETLVKILREIEVSEYGR